MQVTSSLQTKEGKSGEGLETQAARVLPGRAREVVAGTVASKTSKATGAGLLPAGSTGSSGSKASVVGPRLKTRVGEAAGAVTRAALRGSLKRKLPSQQLRSQAAAVPDESWGDALPAAKPPAPIPKPAMEPPPPPKAPMMIAEPKMPPVKGPPPPKQAGAGVPKSEPPVKAAPKAHGIPATR